MTIAFSEQLRRLRKQKDLTQQELGDKVGTKRQNIANWEISKSEPSLGDLVALANYFGVSVDSLVRGLEVDPMQMELEKLRKENEAYKSKLLELIVGKFKVFSDLTALSRVLQELTTLKKFMTPTT
jgi:transcriptional regulator with XRE-family HTH domain